MRQRTGQLKAKRREVRRTNALKMRVSGRGVKTLQAEREAKRGG